MRLSTSGYSSLQISLNASKQTCRSPVTDQLFSLPSERRPSGQETEEDGDRPGVPAGEGDGEPAPRDGRRHAGAGGRPAAEADGPRAGDAEQSVEPAGGHERTDQPREPRETPGAGGQDTVEVPVDLRTVGALTETDSRAGSASVFLLHQLPRTYAHVSF